MPRKLFKRFLPDHHTVRKHKHLQHFGLLLHDPNIWHLNRRSVAGAFAAGLFCAFIPIPFQMILAAAFAIAFRVNLPLSVTLVWITNPITMGPIFYFAYKLGALILQTPTQVFEFELSFNWLMAELGAIWQPFLFGCLILGLVAAAFSFLFVQIVWRFHIFQYIKKRRLRRKERKQQH